ncbi:MAG: FtsQ-type POTRA domain-containing protein, partial [bacterium]|nr:FtsQ-type POTRA domain-containing protein [bacterium]
MRGSIGKIYQKKLHVRRRKRALFISLYILLALGVIFSGLSLLSQAQFMSIEKIIVRGNERAKTETISATALREIAGNYFFFFSKNNIFLYQALLIEEKVLALSLIQSVRVNRNGLREIEINLEERKEDARWCEGSIRETISC